ADEVELLTYMEQFVAARMRGTEALTTLGVFSHPDWWDHLPDAELSDPQRVQLRNDAYRQLLYVAGIGALEGVSKHGSAQETPAVRAALEVLARAERFRPSRTGSILKLCGHSALGEWGQSRPLPPGEPTGAADYYFLGLAHLALRTL